MIFEINADIDTTHIIYDYNSIHSVKNVDSADLSYNDFFQNFMLPNVPCLIAGISTNWESSKLWISNNKKINIDYLQQKYGSDNVCVYNCKERYYNSQKSKTLKFSEYLNSFEDGDYLKNWHLKLSHEEDYFYEVPIFFASDWLNEFYLKKKDDDYRFVYIGANDTWTPFHADVFMSYSWSVNVCGRKKWLLFPPGEEEYLKDDLGNLPYDLNLNEVCLSGRNYFKIIQNAGQAIFVPSGWHHEVWNLDDTISINHNWINGCNFHKMFESLLSNLCDIKQEITDCKEMDNFDEHCQLMLKTLFGMDFHIFYEFLLCIATNRLKMISDESSRYLFHGHKIGLNHIVFDLQAIKNVLNKFVNCEEVKLLDGFTGCDQSPQNLLVQILATLDPRK